MTLPLSVYIAAPFQLRATAQLVRSGALSLGLISTARWLDVDLENWNDEWARKDLDDLDRAQILLLVNPADWATEGTGGRHVELGYAIARRKTIVLLGARTNIFHHLSAIHVAKDLTTALCLVNALAKGEAIESKPMVEMEAD